MPTLSLSYGCSSSLLPPLPFVETGTRRLSFSEHGPQIQPLTLLFGLILENPSSPARPLSIRMLASHPLPTSINDRLRNAYAMWYSYQKVVLSERTHTKQYEKVLFLKEQITLNINKWKICEIKAFFSFLYNSLSFFLWFCLWKLFLQMTHGIVLLSCFRQN